MEKVISSPVMQCPQLICEKNLNPCEKFENNRCHRISQCLMTGIVISSLINRVLICIGTDTGKF